MRIPLTVAAVSLLLVAGCDTHPATEPAPLEPSASAPTSPSAGLTARQPGPTSTIAGVDRSSPDKVARRVVETFYTSDTSKDRGPNDAARRAVNLLTPQFRDTVLNSPPMRSPGAYWDDWAARGVRLRPTVEPVGDDRPADTARRAFRIYSVRQVPVTKDGSRLTPVELTVYVGLSKEPAGWAVESVQER